MEPFNPDNERIWPDENGVNLLGTPLGIYALGTSYLQRKGPKHLLLL